MRPAPSSVDRVANTSLRPRPPSRNAPSVTAPQPRSRRASPLGTGSPRAPRAPLDVGSIAGSVSPVVMGQEPPCEPRNSTALAQRWASQGVPRPLAVGAALVLDDEAGALTRDLRVVARHRAIRQRHDGSHAAGGRPATDFGARAEQGQQASRGQALHAGRAANDRESSHALRVTNGRPARDGLADLVLADHGVLSA